MGRRWAVRGSDVARHLLASGRRSDWISAGEVMIDDAMTDLGEIDARVAVVAINVPGLSSDDLRTSRVSLTRYDHRWLFTGVEAGVAEPRQNNEGAFTFRDVPVGDCEGVLQRADGVALRKRIEVTGKQDQQSVAIAWPESGGTLVIRAAAGLVGPGFNPPKLRSVDGKVHAYLVLQPGRGELRVEYLPAGDYYLTDQDVRDAQHVVDLKINANENTTLELDVKTYVPRTPKLGMATVRCFNENGVPLAGCEVSIRGNGVAPHISERDGQNTIVAEPGQYTLTAKFPGYETVEQAIHVALPKANGLIRGNLETLIMVRTNR